MTWKAKLILKVIRGRAQNLSARFGLSCRCWRMRSMSYQILIVEDQKIAQFAMRITLQSYDCELDMVMSGEEALEKTAQKKYDLIFMDIGLDGELNGLETIQKIRESLNKNQTTPIYILTAHEESSFPEQGDVFQLAQGVIQKPLSDEKCAEIFQGIGQ